MAVPERAAPVVLLAALTSNGKVPDGEIQQALEELWGPIHGWSEPYDLDAYTRYYFREMGSPLMKAICVFSCPYRPERLADAKLAASDIERRWATDGARAVNIDPGYLTPIGLVLASTKPASQRVYLRDGIYAECTLKFVNGGYQPWDWTYPDYRQPELRTFLDSLRGRALELSHSTEGR